jgi:geranylgeranyl reductase family protein
MISIIGAGPAGCYTAYLLSKAGKQVNIFEEHKKIGEPVQCTGLVTSSIKNIIKIKNSIIKNKINQVKIFSKNNCLELRLKNKNLILDRKEFDNDLADMAAKQGAKLFLDHKFINNKIKHNNKIKPLKTDYLIGADGPLSQVAKSNNLQTKTRFLTGLQATIRLKNENYIEFYPDLGCFTWVVPENKDICRIGIASYTNPKQDFEKFLKIRKIKDSQIIEKQGGLIPIYNPKIKTFRKNNVYLIGDAATQVKATTGGGIIQSLKAAEALSNSITKNKDYEKQWRKAIGKDLQLHLLIRNTMDKFKEKDWDLLVKLFKKEKTKKIIEEFDRDYPTKFLMKLAVKEPKLAYFSKFLF